MFYTCFIHVFFGKATPSNADVFLVISIYRNICRIRWEMSVPPIVPVCTFYVYILYFILPLYFMYILPVCILYAPVDIYRNCIEICVFVCVCVCQVHSS